ncbi:SDR family NAD(P)-dependent oxidoreductase [Sorangium sp. So ce1128]
MNRYGRLDIAFNNVRVNAICPAGTDTSMLDRWTKDPVVRQPFIAAHPIGRLADPIEPARAALFLASDEASFVTGIAMPVDGGYALP